MDEHQETYLLTKIYDLKEFAGDAISRNIQNLLDEKFLDKNHIIDTRVNYWKIFDTYIKQRFPDIKIENLNDITKYHEFPDLTKSYCYDEIVSTFNSITEIGKCYKEAIDSNYTYTYYLTEKSYGNCYGNIMKSSVLDGDITYIYENEDINEYLLYVETQYTRELILLDQKLPTS